MSDRIIRHHTDLGRITIIDPKSSSFPWVFFSGGNINCCYEKETSKEGMNDIRIWLDKHCTKQVYVQIDDWKHHPVIFAFTCPEDAVSFAVAYGDEVTRWDQ